MNIFNSIIGINQIGMQIVEKHNKSDDEEIIAKSFLKTRFLLITINIFLLVGSITWIIYSLGELTEHEQMLQGAIDGSDITYLLNGRVERTPLNEVPTISGDFQEHMSVNVYFEDGKVVKIGQSGEQLLVGKRIFDIVKAYVILVIFTFGIIVKTVGKEWFEFLIYCLENIKKGVN